MLHCTVLWHKWRKWWSAIKCKCYGCSWEEGEKWSLEKKNTLDIKLITIIKMYIYVYRVRTIWQLDNRWDALEAALCDFAMFYINSPFFRLSKIHFFSWFGMFIKYGNVKWYSANGLILPNGGVSMPWSATPFSLFGDTPDGDCSGDWWTFQMTLWAFIVRF